MTLWRLAGKTVERLLNRVDRSRSLPRVQAAAASVHFSTPVVDLHNDSLLMNRDLLTESTTGHIDLPRAERGGVALMGFAVATLIPAGFNKDATNDRLPDGLKIIYNLQRSPMAAMSPFDRAVFQAGRLQQMMASSHGRLWPVLRRSDIDRVERRDGIGALFGFEGSQAVGARPENIDFLFRLGYRVAGLAHFIDTPYAASAHGRARTGLTPAGRLLVKRCDELDMIIDISHLADAGIEDVFTLVDGPLIASHTGVRGQIDNNRNIHNEYVCEIARRGGVIGIGFWAETCGSNRPDAIVDTIEYVVDTFGEDVVSLGSDFDGTITPSFDVSQLPILTDIMVRRGWSTDLIEKILGRNALRVLREVLPE